MSHPIPKKESTLDAVTRIMNAFDKIARDSPEFKTTALTKAANAVTRMFNLIIVPELEDLAKDSSTTHVSTNPPPQGAGNTIIMGPVSGSGPYSHILRPNQTPQTNAASSSQSQPYSSSSNSPSNLQNTPLNAFHTPPLCWKCFICNHEGNLNTDSDCRYCGTKNADFLIDQ